MHLVRFSAWQTLWNWCFYLICVNRWSDRIGYRIEIVCLIGTLSTILQYCTHTMKPSDLLLLADVTLRCGMYPAGKVAISWHLAVWWSKYAQHYLPTDIQSYLRSWFVWKCVYITFKSFIEHELYEVFEGLLKTWSCFWQVSILNRCILTAMRILERLPIQTSSSLVKIC